MFGMSRLQLRYWRNCMTVFVGLFFIYPPFAGSIPISPMHVPLVFLGGAFVYGVWFFGGKNGMLRGDKNV